MGFFDTEEEKEKRRKERAANPSIYDTDAPDYLGGFGGSLTKKRKEEGFKNKHQRLVE